MATANKTCVSGKKAEGPFATFCFPLSTPLRQSR